MESSGSDWGATDGYIAFEITTKGGQQMTVEVVGWSKEDNNVLCGIGISEWQVQTLQYLIRMHIIKYNKKNLKREIYEWILQLLERFWKTIIF